MRSVRRIRRVPATCARCRELANVWNDSTTITPRAQTAINLMDNYLANTGVDPNNVYDLKGKLITGEARITCPKT